ncbi:hypothetical protein DFA_05141 [Cavenderia fasciculata]|uniref:G domain-containing protein n=1 Tax=Cavenderia fasciculata TaxID=261658 RepID=F4PNF8_CACFS|nr:uncharacterized protein DFA_05141 [Cavenderia fasciculata]EGG23011.1 hypothetical protein DFA_05141 [Cavenderia fasciculata]|eukprot:XP_004360862.1 hypothetical protein DFA_05141 [Cavenderia fasciculata]
MMQLSKHGVKLISNHQYLSSSKLMKSTVVSSYSSASSSSSSSLSYSTSTSPTLLYNNSNNNKQCIHSTTTNIINNNQSNQIRQFHTFKHTTPVLYQNQQQTTTSNNVMKKILTKEQQEIFNQNIKVLGEILGELQDFNATDASLAQQIKEALEQLDDSLFLLVIVGEFNSGKSSFLNALLGDTYLKEGITPTTSKINIITYGDKQAVAPGRNSEQENIGLPVQWLADIGLVDTPGTNAIVRSHQEITEHFVPRSDMVLFVTSVDRAFSESERKFLESIKRWGKKIVVVLSKADLVESNPMSANPAADLCEVEQFVQENFKNTVGVAPTIFPVSSKLALKAKLRVAKETGGQQHVGSDTYDAELKRDVGWKQSRFADLENFIMKTLDSGERTRLKLLNPLGVASHVLGGLSGEIDTRARVLSTDLKTLQYVEAQLEQFRIEMQKDLEFHLQRIDNVLLKMETRADAFLDDQIQFTNILNLLKSEMVKLKFEKEVIGTTTHEIDSHISSLIDWLVEKNSKQWRDIMSYVDARSSSRLEQLIGTVNRSGDFLNSRKNLLEQVSASTSSTLQSYNREDEATKISSEIRNTIFKTAAIEVGAVGLGTIITASLLDLSGIGIGALALGGLALLPIKKNSLKKSVHSKIADLRFNLSNVMRVHFEAELESGIQKMKDGISPFSSYVNIENKRLNLSQSKVKDYSETIQSIRHDIDRLK